MLHTQCQTHQNLFSSLSVFLLIQILTKKFLLIVERTALNQSGCLFRREDKDFRMYQRYSLCFFFFLEQILIFISIVSTRLGFLYLSAFTCHILLHMKHSLGREFLFFPAGFFFRLSFRPCDRSDCFFSTLKSSKVLTQGNCPVYLMRVCVYIYIAPILLSIAEKERKSKKVKYISIAF